jgi:hypothetical protein
MKQFSSQNFQIDSVSYCLIAVSFAQVGLIEKCFEIVEEAKQVSSIFFHFFPICLFFLNFFENFTFLDFQRGFSLDQIGLIVKILARKDFIEESRSLVRQSNNLKAWNTLLNSFCKKKL